MMNPASQALAVDAGEIAVVVVIDHVLIRLAPLIAAQEEATVGTVVVIHLDDHLEVVELAIGQNDSAVARNVLTPNDGPFFVCDLRLVGDSRSLRARPGFRPLICLETPKHEIVKQQPAFCVIEGRSLILDGLDLVVDAKVLGPRQSAVFLCKGGSLTLRNCTVTVCNRSGAPFSLVRAGPSDQPSRILIERTLIRGALDAVVDLTGGPADVVLRGSAVVNGQGVVVSATGRGAGEWRVFVARCILASRGSAFESSDTSGTPARPLLVRALGSTFAHVEGPTRHPLVTARGGDATTNLLNWEGVDNRYEGWTGWLSAGNPPAVRVASLGLRSSR